MRRTVFVVGLVVLALLVSASQVMAAKGCARVKVSWTGAQPLGPGTLWEGDVTLRARGRELAGTLYWIAGPATLTPRAVIAAFGWGTWEFPGVGGFNIWSIGDLVPFNAELTEFGWDGLSKVVGCGDVLQTPLPPPPAGPPLPYCTQGNGGFFETAWGTIYDASVGQYNETGEGTMAGTIEGRICGVRWKDLPADDD